MADERRRVFSVIGTLPEPGGYAVAKFSRSARPYQEWIQELTQEGASRFYEQFYFAYGHASIADLAHLTLVAENISIVAAIEVLDEQLVDAQESSTRYQDFRRRRYYVPPELADSPLLGRYTETCDRLFETYQQTHRALVAHYGEAFGHLRPADMADDEYQRTVRARAFDVARYLLPSSTYTGLGYLCSARTLERQISRMAGHPLAEVREIADELRKAATEPAFNPLATRIEPTLAAYTAAHPDADTEALLAEVRAATLSGAASAPTLVRYTAPSAYPGAVLDRARDAAAQLLGGIQPDGRRGVCLAQPVSPPQEVAATLLYRGSDLSYEQILAQLQGLSEPEVEHLAGLAYVDRGPHDDLVREARAGFQLVFDLCLDNGAFRDLHRHRNCVQIVKDFTAANGYDEPPDLEAGGRLAAYRQAMEQAGELAEQLEKQLRGLGQYVLPLAYRRRALFKMDSAQVAYMAEQRTAPAGHFSYREIAYQMYAALAERYPTLAQPIRVTDPSIESFFDR